MKKIFKFCLLLICIFLVSCGSPEKSWNTAIENFNNKNYTEAENILNNIIKKYPSSEFVEKSKEKIAEIYWNKAVEKFDNKNYVETEKILNSIIEKYPSSEFARKSNKALQEIQIAKMRSKAQDVINAIKRRKSEIMNGSATMLQVITDTIGTPDKTFDDNNNNILLYGEDAIETTKENLNSVPFVIKVPILGAKTIIGTPDKTFDDNNNNILLYGEDAIETTKENLNSVPFVIKVPILGAKTIKSMSLAFEKGKKINKGIGKVICTELNKIEQETSTEFNNAMYRLQRGYGYYNDADAYQMGVNIANKMAVKMEKVISCEHIFNIQFEKLQIWSFDKRLA